MPADMPYHEAIFLGIDVASLHDSKFCPREEATRSKNYLADALSGRHESTYRALWPDLRKMAYSAVAGRDPINELGRRCHIVSQLFNEGFRRHFGPRAPWFFGTVGDVRFKGESVYDATEDTVTQALRRGVSTEPLGVHVWLTFEDMTIVDLTIMASLLRLHWIDRAEYDRRPIIIGKPNELPDFQFVPYLVHNDFARRVDTF